MSVVIPSAPIRLCAPSGRLGEVPISLLILEMDSFCLRVYMGCMYARVNFSELECFQNPFTKAAFQGVFITQLLDSHRRDTGSWYNDTSRNGS